MGALYLNLCPGWCITTNNAWHGNGRILIGWHPSAFTLDIVRCTSQLIHCKVAAVNGKLSSNALLCMG